MNETDRRRPGAGKPMAPRPAGMGSLRGRPGQTRGNARREVPGGRVKMASARTAALRALQDVVRGDAYAAQALDRQLQNLPLKMEDRRLAAGLFYLAVENRLYLEAALGQFMDAKPDPLVNDIMHIAAAQLLFMDRVPDHAAVDEAVKQVRAMGREGMTGFVNGVLRNLIRARDAGTIRLPDREAEPEKWVSVRYSVAPVIVERLAAAYGIEEAERIAAGAVSSRAVTIRPNVQRMDATSFEAWMDGQKLSWRPGIVPGAYLIEDAGNLADTDGYRRGLFSIQGQSAMLAALAVGAKPGMQILDACAAPGGKTCLMAERMGGAGRVYAWDVHEHRVQLIRAAARRLGLDNIRASMYDARQPMADFRRRMDAVLVDAPCSGLGVIGDKPDIKYRTTAGTLDALPPIQAQILRSAAEAVKVGGLLVYATCTILPEENEDQVRAFLAADPAFEPDGDDGWLPEPLRPRLEGGMLRLLPRRDGLEGFFIARMRRRSV